MMGHLEKQGYVKWNPNARFASPALLVSKVGAESTASVWDTWRLVIDYDKVNQNTIPTSNPVMSLDEMAAYADGAKFWGVCDLSSGFWQLGLDEACQEQFSIGTDRGVWTPTRLTQGQRNATGPFNGAVARALGPLLYKKALLFVDDVLIFARTEAEFVQAWLEVMTALCRAGFKINIHKTKFYRQLIEYCGRTFSKDGVAFSATFVTALLEMGEPVTASDLRSYIASANWVRAAVPRFAELVSPLQDVLTLALQQCDGLGGAANQRAAKAIQLVDVGWNEEHVQAFRLLNSALARAVTLAYPSEAPEIATCVYSDASDDFWAGVVTQVPRADLGKPTLEQQHRLLACVSGKFKGSQLRWATNEKEAFGIKETMVRTRHLLQRPDGVEVYTDHRNLAFVFGTGEALLADGRKQASQRLERWAITMRSFNFRIRHVAGEENTLTDLLTRSGAARGAGHGNGENELQPDEFEDLAAMPVVIMPDGSQLDMGTTPQRVAMARTVRQTRSDAKRGAQASAQASAVSVSGAPVQPDGPAATSTGNVGVLAAVGAQPAVAVAFATPSEVSRFTPEDVPTMTEIVDVQQGMSAEARNKAVKALGLRVDPAQGALVDGKQRLFVPDDRWLRMRICLAAHAGAAGHRGVDVTSGWIVSKFVWLGMYKNIREFCVGCLHCMLTRGGRIVPRPFRETIHARTPNEVLHMDFMKITAASEGEPSNAEYVLVLKDGFSKFVDLVPCARADAASTVDALMAWFKNHGVVDLLVSDRGSHFMNETVAELCARLHVKRHFDGL